MKLSLGVRSLLTALVPVSNYLVIFLLTASYFSLRNESLSWLIAVAIILLAITRIKHHGRNFSVHYSQFSRDIKFVKEKLSQQESGVTKIIWNLVIFSLESCASIAYGVYRVCQFRFGWSKVREFLLMESKDVAGDDSSNLEVTLWLVVITCIRYGLIPFFLLFHLIWKLIKTIVTVIDKAVSDEQVFAIVGYTLAWSMTTLCLLPLVLLVGLTAGNNPGSLVVAVFCLLASFLLAWQIYQNGTSQPVI